MSDQSLQFKHLHIEGLRIRAGVRPGEGGHRPLLVCNGIGASISYPRSIDQLEQIQGFVSPGSGAIKHARHVADHILTLPTTTLLNRRDIDMIEKILTLHFSC